MKEIPKLSMPSTECLKIQTENEPFVDLLIYSEGKISVEMKYAEKGCHGAISVAYARKQVADRLLMAAALLPQGYRFKIYDAWRPFEVQKALYDEYFNRLKKQNTELDEQSLHTLAREFVSYPDTSMLCSYVHSSGGAIDLTVIDPDGNELDMGTKFDDFSSLANTAAFEASTNDTVKSNRRLLYSVMTDSGFTNFPNEWWHYDLGDIFYSAITKAPVKYSSVYYVEQILSEEIK